jgi:hypothetical protein
MAAERVKKQGIPFGLSRTGVFACNTVAAALPNLENGFTKRDSKIFGQKASGARREPFGIVLRGSQKQILGR